MWHINCNDIVDIDYWWYWWLQRSYIGNYPKCKLISIKQHNIFNPRLISNHHRHLTKYTSLCWKLTIFLSMHWCNDKSNSKISSMCTCVCWGGDINSIQIIASWHFWQCCNFLLAADHHVTIWWSSYDDAMIKVGGKDRWLDERRFDGY